MPRHRTRTGAPSINTTALTSTAAQLVQGFGATAHGAIDAWQAGGDRLGRLAAELGPGRHRRRRAIDGEV